jgi:NitT/TauT family transport system substrate-binding protein
MTVRSGSITMQAIAGGQMHAGVGNAVSAGSGILRGIPFVFIGPGAMWNQTVHNSAIMVAENSPIKTAKDLNGQTVAVGSLQGIGQLAFQTYVDQNGGDASAVKFIEIAPSATADAIQSGRVAAGSLDDPEYSNAVESGKAKRLVYTYDWIAKTFYTSVWFTSQGWLQANKETAKRFMEAIVAGGIWGETHREQGRDILEKYTKVHESRTTNVYGRTLNPALIQPLWDASYKYQIFPSPLRAADYCWDAKS